MIKDWRGKYVAILGAARQGIALARYLSTHGAHVLLNDSRSARYLTKARQSLADVPITWVTGHHPLHLLEGLDLLCLSGGVPPNIAIVQQAMDSGVPITNDSQIFLEAVPCPVIGITGSAGKTTTTTLVGRMASAVSQEAWAQDVQKVESFQFRKTWVGGNIGDPLISYVDQMRPNDLAVMEISSFQLEWMTCAPHVAAILNITPNHLDRHGSMEVYTQVKMRILQFQTEQDVAVLSADDPGARNLHSRVRGKSLFFGLTPPAVDSQGAFWMNQQVQLQTGQFAGPVLSREQILLRGEHNILNVLAACALAAAVDIPPHAMRAGVEGFSGVPHRLAVVRVWKGAQWINDSIATAPERSMAAIRSFSEPIVLLAGGRDKDLPWQDFAELVHQRVDHLVLFGEAAAKIYQAVGNVYPDHKPYTITVCSTLEAAVQSAAKIVEPGDVVLLSPGGTSYDAFRDFEERGEKFETWVKALQ